MRTLEFDASGPVLVLVDQTRLPRETVLVRCRTVEDVAHAIRSMQVRGAPAIGVAAAYGLALAALLEPSDDVSSFVGSLKEATRLLGETRPTAVNLRWALDRVFTRGRTTAETAGVEAAKRDVVALADEMAEEDVAVNRRIGAFGLDLVSQGANVLTHCNAGAGDRRLRHRAWGGTRRARGRPRHSRLCRRDPPVPAGAPIDRLGELQQSALSMTLITDSMAGHFMEPRQTSTWWIVGADRIAANGVANKIGTYSVAVLARENGVPFYVAAPISTIDLSLPSGTEIPIEERASREVTEILGTPIAPEGVHAAHPAFDVTPARLVTAIITERGVLRSPYTESLAAAVRASDPGPVA